MYFMAELDVHVDSIVRLAGGNLTFSDDSRVRGEQQSHKTWEVRLNGTKL
jgi:hypothetical protein